MKAAFAEDKVVLEAVQRGMDDAAATGATPLNLRSDSGGVRFRRRFGDLIAPSGRSLADVQDGSRKAIIAAFFANLGIAIAKFVGFLITGSAGLLAEAGHSVADTGNQGLLLFGGKRGKRAADRAHPFGYGPERYFWAFVVALVLFSMGGLFALYEGIHKLVDPHEIESAIVAYGILGVSHRARGVLAAHRGEGGQPRARRPHAGGSSSAPRRRPSCRSCCSRTSAPRLGLVFALFGLTMAEITGNAALGRRRLDRHRPAAGGRSPSSSRSR